MLEATQGAEGAMSIRPLEYRAILAAGIEASEPGNEPEPDSAARANELEARVRELEREMEERERRFELALQAARAEAREAGRSSERSEQSARIAQCAKTLTAALTEFASGRDHYLAQVEREVVHLALAIAARVLHREALMDPLLLSGAVRVALGQLSETTAVRLRVPAAEQEMWSEMLRLMPNLPLRPEVIPDAGMAAGECVIETHLGSVDLGVRSQLAEIERGFFDLLEQRAAISDRQSADQGAALISHQQRQEAQQGSGVGE